MFRLVLPNNRNTFGSPASTVFRSASCPTAVALTASQYNMPTTNGPQQAQQMCRIGQCYGDGVQAGNMRGGTWERQAYMVCLPFFYFLLILLIILCTPSSPPPTKHEKHNLWLHFSCWRPLLPIWAPKTHPMGVFWVLSTSPPIRATEDKKHAHMGMFLVFGGTPAAIFSIPPHLHQPNMRLASLLQQLEHPCHPMSHHHPTLTYHNGVTRMPGWLTRGQQWAPGDRADDGAVDARRPGTPVFFYHLLFIFLHFTWSPSALTQPPPAYLPPSIWHQPKCKNRKSVHSFHVWIYRHTIPPPPSIFSCSPCSQHEKRGLYYTTFFVFRTCSCSPLLPKTNNVSGEARFSTSLHLSNMKNVPCVALFPVLACSHLLNTTNVTPDRVFWVWQLLFPLLYRYLCVYISITY